MCARAGRTPQLQHHSKHLAAPLHQEVLHKTEGYYMWERNAAVGGTPSIGPFQFNTGGGLGPTIPGLSSTYVFLNYTMLQLSDKDFLTVRNEWMNDENGTRYGFKGNYTAIRSA